MVIVCAAVPLKVNVFKVAGIKPSVCPAAIFIFPLMLMPPVRFKLSVPCVIVRLSIDKAAAPVADCESPAKSISKFA